MAPPIQFIITMDPQSGNVSIQAPMENVGLCFHLLGMAQYLVMREKMKHDLDPATAPVKPSIVIPQMGMPIGKLKA